MKQFLALTAAFLLITTAGNAQRTIGGDRFQLNSFGSYLGLNMDYHRDMSIDWMKRHTADPAVIVIDESTPNMHNYAEVTGVVLGMSIGLTPKSKKSNAYNLDQELIVSANIITGREALVAYDNYNETTGAYMRHSTMFCLMDNELNLDMHYQVTHNWSIFKFNAGTGASLGSTFACKVLVMRNSYMDWNQEDWGDINNESLRNTEVSSTEIHDGVCSMFARAYATAGIGFLIGGHVELGTQMRFGAGAEYMPNSQSNSGILTGAFLTQVRYHIPKLNKKGPAPIDYVD